MRVSVARFCLACAFATLPFLNSGCASRIAKTDVSEIAEKKENEELTLEAEYFRKDGKTEIRLVRSSGNKEIDEATLKLLVDLTDKYPDLKEGETMSVKLDDLMK